MSRQAEFDAWVDFRRGESSWRSPKLPCCECGKDSDAYASFDDENWLCRPCVEADQNQQGNSHD